MALMKFREQNQVLWRGVKPAHNGEQVYGWDYQEGIGEDEVYKVTAGKIFFLTYANLATRLNTDSSASGYLVIKTDAAVHYAYLLYHIYDKAGQLVDSKTFPFPIELPAGYVINIVSTDANLDVFADIFGWEE